MGPFPRTRRTGRRDQHDWLFIHGCHHLLQLLATSDAGDAADDELQCVGHGVHDSVQHRVLLGLCQKDLQGSIDGDMIVIHGYGYEHESMSSQ